MFQAVRLTAPNLERKEYASVASSVRPLRLHLRKWIEVVKDYHLRVEPPWRYRERTQVGFFAAASWLLRVPALEEWALAKGTQEAPIRGRCDLWIMTGDYHIEAKHVWCNAHAQDAGSIEDAVNRSLESAQRISEDHPRLAFTFLAPYVPRKRSIAQSASKWLKMVTETRAVQEDSAAIAWYLPERSPKNNDTKGNFGVGIVLLVHKL